MARGSVFRRSGGWAYRIDIGVDASGTRRQRMKQGFATKKQAEAALAKLTYDHADGRVVARSTAKLDDYLQQWLDAIRAQVRPTTHHSYSMAVDRIVKRLGDRPLQSITPLDVERLYSGLLKDGARN